MSILYSIYPIYPCTVSTVNYLIHSQAVEHLGDCSLVFMPRAGSGVVRIDPLRFLAGCRTR